MACLVLVTQEAVTWDGARQVVSLVVAREPLSPRDVA